MADMLFCFVSPSLCKFDNSGSMKQIWFSLPDSSLEHSNSWPTQQFCEESMSKMNFSHWKVESKSTDKSIIILTALCFESYNNFATSPCRRFGTVFTCEYSRQTAARRQCLWYHSTVVQSLNLCNVSAAQASRSADCCTYDVNALRACQAS